jgi:hypothetical protein
VALFEVIDSGKRGDSWAAEDVTGDDLDHLHDRARPVARLPAEGLALA